MEPLQGITVMEATNSMIGAVAGRLLADLGATVVRLVGPDDHDVRRALAYQGWDAGKSSLTLDLASAQHRKVLQDRLAAIDVLIEDFPTATATELGLAGGARERLDGRLVSCHISSFGRDHPWTATCAPVGSLVAARLGLFMEQPSFREGPAYMGFPMVDYGTALLTVIGALAALFDRERSGRGQEVDISLYAGALAQLGLEWSWIEHDPSVVRSVARERTGYYARNRRRIVVAVVQCADGEYLQVHTGGAGAFDRTMKLLGLDDRIPPASGLELGSTLTDDEAEVLATELAPSFASRGRREWLDLLQAADVAALPVNRPGEVYFDDHVRIAGFVGEIDDPGLGPVLRVAPPIRRLAEQPREPGADARPRRLTPSPEHPLDGVLIVDFGMYFAGPYAARLLADLGAEVVKIEPLTGDKVRPQHGTFEGAHRGKRGVALDLKAPDGLEAFLRLASEADVVQHNLRPGAAERLGVDFVSVAAINDDVVYLESPGYGRTGPKAQLQSFAPLHAGFSGLYYTAAGAGNRPLRPHQSEDYYTGMTGAIGVLAALLHRERHGVGAQHLEAPQLAASLFTTSHLVVRPDGEVLADLVLDPDQIGYDAVNRIYRCFDGWICIASPRRTAEAGLVAAVVGPTDGETATVERVLAGWTTDDAVERITAAGIPSVVVAERSMKEAFLDSEQNLAAGTTVEFARGSLGRVRSIGLLLRFSRSRSIARRGAPQHGEHTREVLAEMGYDAEVIAEMETRRTIKCLAAPAPVG
jgi:crotonobetainyl-CoA:carnitine CoA-transferase CaiB-like acyl-CoA transferase